MARRGRRTGVVLLVLLFLLVAVLVVADRVAASMAEREVAKRVADQARSEGVNTGTDPTVDITGFPFLTQVASGNFDRIDVHMRDLRAQGIAVPKLDVRATDVKAKASDVMNGSGEVRATTMTGTATVAYSSLGSTFGLPDLEVSGKDGKLLLRAPVNVAGFKFTALATAGVSIANGKVRVKVTDVRPENTTLPPGSDFVLDSLASQLSRDVALPRLPYDLTLRGVTVGADGLNVSAVAQDVLLAG